MKKLENIPAIILAGGMGNRIRNIDRNIPKPLIKLGEYNLLEHNIFSLKKEGIKNFIISIGYKGDMIREYFGDGKKRGINIDYVKDPYPLGDAGAFKQSYPKSNETVILANADEIKEGIKLEEMLKFHVDKKAIATIAVIKPGDKITQGIVKINNRKRITRFTIKPDPKEIDSYYGNGGMYIIEKEALKYFPEGYSILEDIRKKMLNSKKVYAFIFEGAYFNVGTPEIFKEANDYFRTKT